MCSKYGLYAETSTCQTVSKAWHTVHKNDDQTKIIILYVSDVTCQVLIKKASTLKEHTGIRLYCLDLDALQLGHAMRQASLVNKN